MATPKKPKIKITGSVKAVETKLPRGYRDIKLEPSMSGSIVKKKTQTKKPITINPMNKPAVPIDRSTKVIKKIKPGSKKDGLPMPLRRTLTTIKAKKKVK